MAMLLLCLPAWPQPALAQSPQPAPSAQATARPKVALVLSGGGARGVAHIGVLRALEELRVPVDIVVGTSFGAVVGGAFAGGQSVAELERLVLSTDWRSVLQDRPPRDELNWRRREDDTLVASRVEFGVTREGLSLPRGAFSSTEVERLLHLLVPDTALVPVDDLPLVFRAVATDMLTGERAVLTNVPLFTALRASVSVPGAFAPIKVDGRPLGDGGLVSNLPVQLARELGAEVIIAVNLGTPLGGPESLESALGIAQQMINILTEQNVRESLRALKPQDVLIVPDLAGQSFLDFSDPARSIAAGLAAAHAQATRLQALAVEPAVYAQFREHLLAKRGELAETARVNSVRIERRDANGGSTTLPPGLVTLKPGEPLTAAALADATRQVQRQLEVERVDTIVSRDGTSREVILVPVDSPSDRSRLRLGLELQANSYRENDFALAGLYRLGGIGWRDAEWRTAVLLGSRTEVRTEYFEPLEPGSPWFASLGAAYHGYDFTLFSQTTFDPLARFNSRSSYVDASVGRRFGNAGHIRLGYAYRKLDFRSPFNAAQGRLRASYVTSELVFDTLDSLGFPTRGYLLSAKRGIADRLDGLLARRVGPWAGHVYLASERDQYVTAPMALGGFLRLTGAPPDSLYGSKVDFGRAVAAREVGSLPVPLGGTVRLGLSLEVGRIAFEQQGLGSKTRAAGSVFAVADTRFGPVFLAWGNTPGIGSAVYLFLGSVLLPHPLLR